jgi:hypothetical protein
MAAEQNTKKFKCDICDYSTTNQSILNRHTNFVHLKMKIFECTQCFNKFGSNARLQKHIVSVHNKRKEFQCDHCDEAFCWKGDLNNHKNVTHRKIKNYRCDLCDYSSYTSATLVHHSKDAHCMKKRMKKSMKKNIKCYACDKAFSLKTSLVIHVNRVHKQQNYSCDSCEWCSFTSYYKHELENHVIRKHAHQNDDSSDDLVKTDQLIKEAQKDQMFVSIEKYLPETYSDHKYVDQVNIEEILKTTEIEIKEEYVADPCAIDIDDKGAIFDHKNFEEILVETTEIDILKEECVADPLAINLDNKETNVKQES